MNGPAKRLLDWTGCCGLAAIAAACSLAYGVARAEDTLSIATWGGAYGQSQETALFEPFAKETGTRIATEIYDGSLAKIREMIDGDNSLDVVDLSPATLAPLCADGLLETIDVSSLGTGPSGETVSLCVRSSARAIARSIRDRRQSWATRRKSISSVPPRISA